MNRTRLLIWLSAVLPFVPLVALVWANHTPAAWERDGHVIHLAGKWRGADAALVSVTEARKINFDDSAWAPINLPGVIPSKSGTGIIHRRATLPPTLVNRDLLLVIEASRGTLTSIFINGNLIGRKGEASVVFMGAEESLDAWLVPASLATSTIDVTIEANGGLLPNGITDPRILLGQYELLAPWHFQLATLRNFLLLGALVVLLALCAVIVIIWRIQGSTEDTPLFRSAVLLMGAVCLYTILKAGLLSPVLNRDQMVYVILLTIFGLGFAIPEFNESYFLRRVSRFRRVNRAVSTGAIVISLWPAAILSVYKLYIIWLFIMVGYTLFLSIRAVVRRVTVFAPLTSSAMLMMSAVSINDLLVDMDKLYSPRLYNFGVSGLGVISGVVVIAEFLRLVQENRRLTTSLAIRNTELAEALQKAEQSLRLKSEFLATTSHELRTPLNAIINIPQELLEQFDQGQPGIAPEETAQLLSKVVGSGNHLLAVVNDILDFSKLEAGRVVLHPEAVDVAELLKEAANTIESLGRHAGVTLSIDAPPAVQLEIDRVKISQVLVNLLGNAIKFSSPGGSIWLKAEVVGAPTLPADQRLIISVKDEGIGIAPENQQLIFEGFRQVESTTTRRFGGTGLGLAISKSLVAIHQGSLRLESSVGHGSTFSIDLPMSAKASHVLFSSTQVIVVVDDETSAADTTAMALKPLGYRVVAVKDPREAIDRIRSERPALVVLDVMMPRISGIEVLRVLKGDAQLGVIPVLVSSAYPDNRPIVEELGAMFIGKPWRPGELLREASKMLAHATTSGAAS